MTLSSFMHNLLLFLVVARDLAILSHLNSVSGIELMVGWLILIFLGWSSWRSACGAYKWALDSDVCPPASLRLMYNRDSPSWLPGCDGSGRAAPDSSLISLGFLPHLGSKVLPCFVSFPLSFSRFLPNILSVSVVVCSGRVGLHDVACYHRPSSFCLCDYGNLALLLTSVSSSLKWVLVKKLTVIQADIQFVLTEIQALCWELNIVSVNPPTSPVRWGTVVIYFVAKENRWGAFGQLGIGTRILVWPALNPVLLTTIMFL